MSDEKFATWLKPGLHLRGECEYRAGAGPLALDREEIEHFRRCGLLLRTEAPEVKPVAPAHAGIKSASCPAVEKPKAKLKSRAKSKRRPARKSSR